MRGEISLDQFLLDLRSIRDLKLPLNYAFVIGSGAAAASGVPTGRVLAMRWLKELFALHRPGAAENELATWNAADALGLPDLDVADPAPFYGELYRLRYSHQPLLGQEFLRSQILGRAPTYGYAALAQIQTETPHKHAVTTNFDHLLEEAYKRFFARDLIVCASDDQASTAQRLPDEPLLAKIHGDIFHETKNDAPYIADLRESWFDPLRTLFKRSAPLFVGYGGNDFGFMRFLAEEVNSGWFPHKPVWAYRSKDGLPAGKLVTAFAANHDVLFMPIPGFDEFLFLVAEALDLKPLTKRLQEDFAGRIRAYQDSYDQMATSLRAARPEEARAGGALDRALAPPDRRDWWEWWEAALNAATFGEGVKILEQGLARLPESPELKSFYAQFRSQANPQDVHFEALAREALVEAERQYGTDHPGTLTCVSHLANLLTAKGDHTAAEPLLRRALETRERVLGPDHPDTLGSLNSLARLLAAKGDRAAAEPLFRRALKTRERVLGPDHPDTLGSLNNLAVLLSAKGDRTAAEPLHRRALETRERVLGPDHPDTLVSLNNLASLLSAKGDRAAAESLYRRALGIRERVLGPDHPDTLTIVNNLATLLSQKGDRRAAEPLFRRALETQERVLGPDHPHTLASLNNLALLLSEKGDRADAESLHRRALERQERVLGPDHPDTLMSVSNLALLLSAKGDHAGAEPLCRRALKTRERVLGPDHPDSLASLGNLALLLLGKGDHAGAEPLCRRALETSERVLGPHHPETLRSVNNLARVLSAKGDHVAAEPLYRRALETRERVLGPDHRETLMSVNNLASVLSAKGERVAAEALHRRALEGQERVLGPDDPDTS